MGDFNPGTFNSSGLFKTNNYNVSPEPAKQSWYRNGKKEIEEEMEAMERRQGEEEEEVGRECEEEAHSHVLTLMGQYLIIWNGVAVSCSRRCSSLLEHLQGRQVIKL